MSKELGRLNFDESYKREDKTKGVYIRNVDIDFETFSERINR